MQNFLFKEATESFQSGNSFWNCLDIYYTNTNNWQEKFLKEEKLFFFGLHLPKNTHLMVNFNNKEEIFIEGVAVYYIPFKNLVNYITKGRKSNFK